jgi:hypothetical protein
VEHILRPSYKNIRTVHQYVYILYRQYILLWYALLHVSAFLLSRPSFH